MKNPLYLIIFLFLICCNNSDDSDDASPTCVDPSLIDLEAVCTEEYAPVCGCDGITYSNACVALTSSGVLAYGEGACE